jgi:hypothetical protein
MSVEMLAQLPGGSSAVPQMNYDRYLVTEDAFARAVERGRCFGVCNQVGVTSQAGLSGTTPVLSLVNPAGSGITGRLWFAGATVEVAAATAGSIVLAAGTNTVAAAVTGTLTTAHRNLKLGSAGVAAGAQGNRIVPMLAATLPAAPVAICLLGVLLTGAITTQITQPTSGRWFYGAIAIQPGVNLSIQTLVATGASGLLCEFIWEEFDLVN